MKTMVSIMTVVLFSATSFAQNGNLPDILNSYLKLKDALVQSNNTQAAKQAADLVKLLEQAGELEGKETMLKTAQKISKTPDIEKQRLSFADLFTALWNVVKDAKDLSRDVYYQYCPMKKTYWLSSEPAIKNPYYGSKMLTCGNVSDKTAK